MRRRGIRLVAVVGLARVDGQPYGRDALQKRVRCRKACRASRVAVHTPNARTSDMRVRYTPRGSVP